MSFMRSAGIKSTWASFVEVLVFFCVITVTFVVVCNGIFFAVRNPLHRKDEAAKLSSALENNERTATALIDSMRKNRVAAAALAELAGDPDDTDEGVVEDADAESTEEDVVENGDTDAVKEAVDEVVEADVPSTADTFAALAQTETHLGENFGKLLEAYAKLNESVATLASTNADAKAKLDTIIDAAEKEAEVLLDTRVVNAMSGVSVEDVAEDADGPDAIIIKRNAELAKKWQEQCVTNAQESFKAAAGEMLSESNEHSVEINTLARQLKQSSDRIASALNQILATSPYLSDEDIATVLAPAPVVEDVVIDDAKPAQDAVEDVVEQADTETPGEVADADDADADAEPDEPALSEAEIAVLAARVNNDDISWATTFNGELLTTRLDAAKALTASIPEIQNTCDAPAEHAKAVLNYAKLTRKQIISAPWIAYSREEGLRSELLYLRDDAKALRSLTEGLIEEANARAKAREAEAIAARDAAKAAMAPLIEQAVAAKAAGDTDALAMANEAIRAAEAANAQAALATEQAMMAEENALLAEAFKPVRKDAIRVLLDTSHMAPKLRLADVRAGLTPNAENGVNALMTPYQAEATELQTLLAEPNTDLDYTVLLPRIAEFTKNVSNASQEAENALLTRHLNKVDDILDELMRVEDAAKQVLNRLSNLNKVMLSALEPQVAPGQGFGKSLSQGLAEIHLDRKFSSRFPFIRIGEMFAGLPWWMWVLELILYVLLLTIYWAPGDDREINLCEVRAFMMFMVVAALVAILVLEVNGHHVSGSIRLFYNLMKQGAA